jgi:hypothetical protein
VASRRRPRPWPRARGARMPRVGPPVATRSSRERWRVFGSDGVDPSAVLAPEEPPRPRPRLRRLRLRPDDPDTAASGAALPDADVSGRASSRWVSVVSVVPSPEVGVAAGRVPPPRPRPPRRRRRGAPSRASPSVAPAGVSAVDRSGPRSAGAVEEPAERRAEPPLLGRSEDGPSAAVGSATGSCSFPPLAPGSAPAGRGPPPPRPRPPRRRRRGAPDGASAPFPLASVLPSPGALATRGVVSPAVSVVEPGSVLTDEGDRRALVGSAFG